MLSEVSWMNPTRFVYMDPTGQSPPPPAKNVFTPHLPPIWKSPTYTPPSHKIFISSQPKINSNPPLNKNFQVITQ